jgi:hypothetical protein
MKIRSVGAELFHEDRRTDGQTDMAKLIVAFRNLLTQLETGQLMLYREIIAVCSEIDTKYINTVWAERRVF